MAANLERKDIHGERLPHDRPDLPNDRVRQSLSLFFREIISAMTQTVFQPIQSSLLQYAYKI